MNSLPPFYNPENSNISLRERICELKKSMRQLNTICPDCDSDCDAFEFLEQNGGVELWVYCKECGMETFRVGENMFVANLITALVWGLIIG